MKATKYLVILLLMLTACKTADKGITEAEAQQTRDLIAGGNYELTMDWALPLATNAMNQISNANLLPMDSRSGRINLVGTSSYIRSQGDILEVYLPYFGTRQLTVTPGDTNGAIQFEGVPERYEAIYNEKKQLTAISFRMKDENEQYDVNVKVFGNKNVNVYVNSTHRNSIQYTGKLGVLENL
ncbi:MAG: DUF4251 domain-containing protein [Flavobacteriaceae bacterium]|nr:DUF4251 domain-containing protein [Flavobacteriaceae bacterium]